MALNPQKVGPSARNNLPIPRIPRAVRWSSAEPARVGRKVRADTMAHATETWVAGDRDPPVSGARGGVELGPRRRKC